MVNRSKATARTLEGTPGLGFAALAIRAAASEPPSRPRTPGSHVVQACSDRCPRRAPAPPPWVHTGNARAHERLWWTPWSTGTTSDSSWPLRATGRCPPRHPCCASPNPRWAGDRRARAPAGCPAVLRDADGWALSAAGSGILAHAEEIEARVLDAENLVAGKDTAVEGGVRIAASEWMIATVLAPRLTPLLAEHGRLSVISSPRSPRHLNLFRREANVALRPSSFLGSKRNPPSAPSASCGSGCTRRRRTCGAWGRLTTPTAAAGTCWSPRAPAWGPPLSTRSGYRGFWVAPVSRSGPTASCRWRDSQGRRGRMATPRRARDSTPACATWRRRDSAPRPQENLDGRAPQRPHNPAGESGDGFPGGSATPRRPRKTLDPPV